MKVSPTEIPGVITIEPMVHGDDRGFFLETFTEERYAEAGIDARFVQDNFSRSKRQVLRGLHFQKRQAKLVTVTHGRVFDVAVDIRPDSPSRGRWHGVELSDDNHLQLFLPVGIAHGFYVLSDEADVWYKTTDFYRPEEEGGLLWSDPELGIEWPAGERILSERDRRNPSLGVVLEKLSQWESSEAGGLGEG